MYAPPRDPRSAGGTLPAPLCDIASLRRLDLLHCRLASGCVHAGQPPQFSRLTNLVCAAGGRMWVTEGKKGGDRAQPSAAAAR